MRASKQRRRAGYCAVILCSASALASCGNEVDSRPQNATGGASPGTGGSATGGSAMGGSSTGGSATGGSSTGGSATGGGSTGGSATGGGSTGETDGSVDVCKLYGAPCCVPAIEEVGPAGGCAVDVLAGWVGTTYEYAALEQKVASLSDVLVSLTDADIARAAAEPPPSGRFEMHLTPEASSRHGAFLEAAARLTFRLSCGGQSLFVGMIYEVHGAAALRTPVLHVSRDTDGSVVLRLGGWQGAWMDFGAGEVEAKARIDRPELRAALCQRGVLREELETEP